MTSSEKRHLQESGMPFGGVFGALFLGVYGAWSALGLGGANDSLVARSGIALASFALALALLGRRPWARWAAAAFAVAVAGSSLRLVSIEPGVLALVSFAGAITAAGLLAVPATGRVARLERANRPAAAGRVLALAAGLGAVGWAAGLWLSGAPAAATAGAGTASAPAVPAVAGRSARVAWSDFGTGLDRARAESKPVLATFVTGWCGYCRKMDSTTWKDPAVVARLGDLVPVRVDAEETRERRGFAGARLAERYRVEGYPTLLLLDAGGRVVSRAGGYLAPADLLAWLDGTLGRENARGATNLPVSRP